MMSCSVVRKCVLWCGVVRCDLMQRKFDRIVRRCYHVTLGQMNACIQLMKNIPTETNPTILFQCIWFTSYEVTFHFKGITEGVTLWSIFLAG